MSEIQKVTNDQGEAVNGIRTEELVPYVKYDTYSHYWRRMKSQVEAEQEKVKNHLKKHEYTQALQVGSSFVRKGLHAKKEAARMVSDTYYAHQKAAEEYIMADVFGFNEINDEQRAKELEAKEAEEEGRDVDQEQLKNASKSSDQQRLEEEARKSGK